ncbi:MAG TPA: hypothetical protein VES20_19995 [Bryobacteraceae bacterium]|nr:hypothetical protein [Bryobacteraceae bacterium]
MKKPLRVALVCAGAMNSGSLSRFPRLRERISWVMSTTPSAASRAANSLGRGKPVRCSSEIQVADVFAIRAPEAHVNRLIHDLSTCGIAWEGRVVVILDSVLDSGALARVEQAGAYAASIDCVNTIGDHPLVEGHEEALRLLGTLCDLKSHRALELRKGAKADYMNAVNCANSSFLPLVGELVECLMKAGMTKAAADNAAASLFTSAVQAWTRAGRRLLKRQPSPLTSKHVSEARVCRD